MAPQLAWHPVIQLVRDKYADSPITYFTTDRYGSGLTTGKDPSPADPVFGNDLNSVVADLQSLLTQVGSDTTDLVLVGKSIGCAVARQYTATFPGRVAGIVLLDSILANSDFHDDIFPDPSDPTFDADKLPANLSVDDLHKARQLAYKMFSPTLPNPQGFDRRNMKQHLPRADGPTLVGVQGKPPKMVVVGHDPEKFAQDSITRQSMPEGSVGYVQSVWEEYNEGLTKIGQCKEGVQIAPGAGHFVQVDNPTFVADTLVALLVEIGWV